MYYPESMPGDTYHTHTRTNVRVEVDFSKMLKAKMLTVDPQQLCRGGEAKWTDQ